MHMDGGLKGAKWSPAIFYCSAVQLEDQSDVDQKGVVNLHLQSPQDKRIQRICLDWIGTSTDEL